MKNLIMPDGTRKKLKSISINVHRDDDVNPNDILAYIVRLNNKYDYKVLYRTLDGKGPLQRAVDIKDELYDKWIKGEDIYITHKLIFNLPL